jgi:hypothetical protein
MLRGPYSFVHLQQFGMQLPVQISCMMTAVGVHMWQQATAVPRGAAVALVGSSD